MTKADLAKKIAESTNLANKDAKKILDVVFDVVKSALATEGQQVIQGFGTFKIRERAAREGRNPHTGAKITIPATKSVSFKPAPSYKASLNPEAPAKKAAKAADAKAAKAPAKKAAAKKSK